MQRRLQIGVERGRHVAGQDGAVARAHRRRQVGLLAVLLHQMVHLGLEPKREPVQQGNADASRQRLVARDEHVGPGDAPAEIESAETPGLEAELRARRQAAIASAGHQLAVDEEIDLGTARAAHPQIVAQQEDARDVARRPAVIEVEPRDPGHRRAAAERIARYDAGIVGLEPVRQRHQRRFARPREHRA